MSFNTNIFAELELITPYIDNEELMEGRFENNGDGNPIYVGYTPYPNGDPALPIWYLLKITYTGQAIIRKQVPDSGQKFGYIWNDRVTYFS